MQHVVRQLEILVMSNNHYENTPMQYTVIFHSCKNYNFQMKNCEFVLIFAVNIDRGYTLEPPQWTVLMSTHNLCFRAKIKNKVYPCKPQYYYIKVGCKWVFITRTCLHDKKTKRKNMCVSCYISKTIRVGRSILIFFISFFYFP